MSSVPEAVAAIRAGKLVVIPTDTVYGLACAPDDESAVRALSDLKGRPAGRPIALVASSVDDLWELLPELGERESALVRALLPGPFTLVLSNPGGRFPWLTGERPATIGVRVPELEGAAREILAGVDAMAATSANRHGDADPRSFADVPRELLDAVAAAVDGGDLLGAPSTVLDLTGPEPRVPREGAVPASDALARVSAATAQ